MAEAKKKKNFIAAYFTPFGLRQICDILMVTAAIVLIIGLGVHAHTFVVALVGVIMMAVGSAIAIYRAVLVLISDTNRRSMAYKNAITNTVIMGVIFALCVFMIIYIAVVLM